MKSSLTDSYTLNNGVDIPCLGFGTWQAADGGMAVRAVREALAAGYRHIDTAAAYGNEESVGTAIRASGIAREKIFVTTKLWNPEHGYEPTREAIQTSLKKLGLGYLDLYLIHWPNPLKFRDCWKEKNAESWNAMEEYYRAGMIRALGVSNFLPHHLDALLGTADVAPAVNQIRLCPGETQPETVACCRLHGILPEAYSPLGTGRVFDVPEMKAVAGKYGKTVAQVCLRWSLQMGWLPLPKSVTAERIRENAGIFDFELSAQDMQAIAGLKNCCGPTKHPDHTPW